MDEKLKLAETELQLAAENLTAARLVRSHAADPDRPFASPALSSGLRSYLTSPDFDVPSVRRRTLQTYLEEISRL